MHIPIQKKKKKKKTIYDNKILDGLNFLYLEGSKNFKTFCHLGT